MIKKPNPGATCPTRVPMFLFLFFPLILVGACKCFDVWLDWCLEGSEREKEREKEMKIGGERGGNCGMERDMGIGGFLYGVFDYKNLKFYKV